MLCDFPQERLSAYVDGELDQQETESIEQHLICCHTCSKVVQEITTLRTSLNVLLNERGAPDSIEQSILEGLQIVRHTRQARHLFEVYLVAMGAALFGVILLTMSPLLRIVRVAFRLITAAVHGLLVMSALVNVAWVVGVAVVMIAVVGLSLAGIRRMLHFIQNEAAL